jgi:hypothetical protein
LAEPLTLPSTAVVASAETRGEAALRQCLDRAIGQALVDPAYAERLLADPTLALAGVGCTPRQWLTLRRLRSASLRDFAQQVLQRFWLDATPASLAEPEDIHASRAQGGARATGTHRPSSRGRAPKVTSQAVTRQCAWCGRVQGPDGAYGGARLPILPSPATHGICPTCRADVQASVERLSAP